jgi:hypothetical protein
VETTAVTNPPSKSGKFEDYEFPGKFTARDRIEFLNGMLADYSSVASIELFIDSQDGELVVRVWFAWV